VISLGVDTSTPVGSVALAEGDRVLGEINLTSGGRHQENLLRSVDLLLDLLGLDVSKVDVLSVSLGPGTFTGMRIGIATVKGLALALGVPVYGLSTLAAMAFRFRERGLPVAPLINAGRQEVFAALYSVDAAGFKVLNPEQGGPPMAFLKTLPATPVLFCGDGAMEYHDRIMQVRAGRDFIEAESCFLGGTLARWGSGRLAAGTTWSLAEVKPNYIRPPDAEQRSAP